MSCVLEEDGPSSGHTKVHKNVLIASLVNHALASSQSVGGGRKGGVRGGGSDEERVGECGIMGLCCERHFCTWKGGWVAMRKGWEICEKGYVL